MAYTQADKLLSIKTILDDDPAEKQVPGDPLLLVKLEAGEGISRPFTYDIVMLRDTGRGAEGNQRPPLDVTKLIGTAASVAARSNVESPFLYRFGVFESFEQVMALDAVHALVKFREFYTYRARVVPWVKLLMRDVCYRVFENKSVLDIINAVKSDVSQTFPNLKIDPSALSGSYPTMDYCVQFGESTFDFLSRLMSRFGISYYFGHKEGADDLLNETMVLVPQNNPTTSPARSGTVSVVDDDPDQETIAKLVRRYRPPERKVIVGGFNQLTPATPFYQDKAVDPGDDLLKSEGGPPSQTKWLGATAFAEPLNSSGDASGLADVRGAENQTDVITLTGIGRNTTFLPGYSFHITPHSDTDPADLVNRDYVIDWHSISCHDYNYENLWGWQVLDVFFNTFSTIEADSASFTDTAAAKVSLWVSNNAQNQVFPIGPAQRGSANSPGQLWWPTMNAGADGATRGVPLYLSALATSFWLLAQTIDVKRMLGDNQNQAVFSNSFIAFPDTTPVEFPLPLAARPIARGPHTAVVIGPDGTDTSSHDIYYDAIGRVRVRFPWDPGPPSGGALPPVFPVSNPEKPTTSGDNTCWLRVVDGWAGRHYGLQFLPRIGQEVLVDFLDGDPERPVIVGRLYNADQGTTNLPFVDDQTASKQLNNLTDLPPTAAYDTPYSGIKTYSIPTNSSLPKRFHLLRFNDKRGSEQYLIRSQQRMDVTAFGDYYDTTGGDRHLTVGSTNGGGDVYTKMFGNYNLHTVKSRFELIEQNYEQNVKGNTSLMIGGNWSKSVTGTDSLSAATIVLSATANISLVVGSSSVVITPASVAITGPMVLINSGGSPSSAAAVTVTTPTDPTAADPGDQNP